MKLSGNRCMCAACDEYFNSEYAFSMHRVGDHAVKRWCLSTEEMLSKGMAKNTAGYWVSELGGVVFKPTSPETNRDVPTGES